MDSWDRWMEKHPTIKKIWKFFTTIAVFLAVLSFCLRDLPIVNELITNLSGTVLGTVLSLPTNTLVVAGILVIAIASGAQIFILRRMWRDLSRLIASGMIETSLPSSARITVYAGCTNIDAEYTANECHYNFRIRCRVRAMIDSGCPPQCASFRRHKRTTSGGGALSGGTIGGIIGLAGGPVGVLIGMFLGGLVGNALEDANLPPESTALEQRLAECRSKSCGYTFQLTD